MIAHFQDWGKSFWYHFLVCIEKKFEIKETLKYFVVFKNIVIKFEILQNQIKFCRFYYFFFLWRKPFEFVWFWLNVIKNVFKLTQILHFKEENIQFDQIFSNFFKLKLNFFKIDEKQPVLNFDQLRVKRNIWFHSFKKFWYLKTDYFWNWIQFYQIENFFPCKNHYRKH